MRKYHIQNIPTHCYSTNIFSSKFNNRKQQYITIHANSRNSYCIWTNM